MGRSTARALLVAALIALAGCGATGGPGTGGTPTATPLTHTSTATDGATPETPTATPTAPAHGTFVFDHGGLGDPVIEGGITHEESTTRRYYVTTISSSDATDRFDESLLPGEPREFVDNTSFATSSLVAIQSFPASSVPDYRVESVRRDGGTLRVSINDSSPYGTDDITVETVLLRVRGPTPDRVVVTTEEGDTFDTGAGVVTVTPRPTPTPEGDVELPYAAENDSENVEEPRDIRLRNEGEATNGYRLTVTYHDRPDCLDETPACGEPTEAVPIIERTGKLRPGANLTISDVAARKGSYTVEVTAEVPTQNGSRRTVADSLDWELNEDAGDLLVTVTDETVRIVETS